MKKKIKNNIRDISTTAVSTSSADTQIVYSGHTKILFFYKQNTFAAVCDKFLWFLVYLRSVDISSLSKLLKQELGKSKELNEKIIWQPNVILVLWYRFG